MSEYTGGRSLALPMPAGTSVGDEEYGPPQYSSWQDAAWRGHELMSYAWRNRPSMNQLVPGYDPNEGTVQKLLDYGSLPARMLAAPLMQGGEAFRRWMAGDQGPETRQMLLDSVLGLGGSTMLPVRPAGSFGVFGGIKAATADLDKLKLAQHMEKGVHEVSMDSGQTWNLASAPMHPKDIWEKTGWFRDVDGNWKFEIPDIGAHFKTDGSGPTISPQTGNVHFPSSVAPTTLEASLEHPELFMAYPELAGTPMHSTGMMAALQGLQGAVYKGGSIGLTGGPPREVLSTALHEVQHKIQDVEGFARGGSTSEFLPPGFQDQLKETNANIVPYENQIRDAGLNPYTVISALKAENAGQKMFKYQQAELDSARNRFADGFLNEFHDLHEARKGLLQQQSDAFRQYRGLAGEVESRNVQERFEQGDYASHPHETTGYPAGSPQIVRFRAPGENLQMDSFGAWHGSPHLFEPEPGAPLGAFRPIDEVAYTGEGTQAFAYGHYVAGRRQTSETYMRPDSLIQPPGVHTLDGKVVKPIDYLDTDPSAYIGLNHLGYNGGDHAAAIKDMQTEARRWYQEAQKYPVGAPGSPNSETRMEFLNEAKSFLQGAKWLDANKDRVGYTPPPPPNPGHLYQVAIKPDEHELLDWDRPLSEQHPQVQENITKAFGSVWLRDRGSWSGEKFYNHMGKNTGTAQEASQELHDAGIPGVKFQDAGSRGLPHDHPDVTRNYVIFHHSNLKVIDRDGQHFGLEPVTGDPWEAKPGGKP